MKVILDSIYRIFVPVWIGLLLFFASLLALPAIQHGATPLVALLRVIATRTYLSIFASTIFALLIAINLFNPPQRPQKIDFIKLRFIGTLLTTFSFLFSLAADLMEVSFKALQCDALRLLPLLLMFLYLWTFPPGPISSLMNRLVDYKQLAAKFDERFQAIWQLSAATALYWTLGLIFVFGSLYDITVTHQWPIRSVVETLLIFLIWTLAYRFRRRRM